MEPTTTIDPKLTIEWLNKLVAMAQWDAKLPFYTARLFSKPQPYQQFRREAKVEKVQVPDPPTTPGVETPFALAHRKLLERIAATRQLRDMFAADEDPFNNAPADILQLLAEVSDLTTDPQSMVYSRNGTFLAVVEALRQSKELQTEALLADGLNKFLTLFETNKPVAKMLFELASSPHWCVIMASLRDNREYTLEEEPAVTETLRNWQQKLTAELRALLFKPGHLSRAPIALIKVAWTENEVFDQARESIPVAQRENDVFEWRQQVANVALPLFQQKAKTVFDGIEAELKVLAIVARHFINVRKFAKLDGFVYTWPDIARLAMSNYAALEYVEEVLVGKKKPTETELESREATDLYNKCEKNDALIRFLRLRPYFREIDDDELRRYRPLAPVVITESPPVSGPQQARSADFTPQQPPTPPPVSKAFVTRTLQIKKAGNVTPSADLIGYEITFSGLGVTYQTAITLSVTKLLDEIRSAMGAKSDSNLQEVLRELFSSSPTVAEGRMARGGGALQNRILTTNIHNEITDLLQRGNRLRIVIDSLESDIHFLPWEWLPNASGSVLLSSPDCSIVRGFVEPSHLAAPSILAPLRLLSIFPTPPTGRRFTSDETVKNLTMLVSTESAEYEPLLMEEATLRNLDAALESFKPHVVHFEGYISSPSATGSQNQDLRILFSPPDHEGIPLGEFGEKLLNNEVQLLSIGRNGISRIYENPGALVGLQMIQTFLPAVVAPIRAIDDASATTFTTEFYRAFLQGNTLEAAVHIARRKLASKGGDWSVFALFADSGSLDSFQLLRETA